MTDEQWEAHYNELCRLDFIKRIYEECEEEL